MVHPHCKHSRVYYDSAYSLLTGKRTHGHMVLAELILQSACLSASYHWLPAVNIPPISVQQSGGARVAVYIDRRYNVCSGRVSQ